MISVKNTVEKYQTISMRATVESFNPGDIDLTKTYQNTVQYGSFINYEINPSTNPSTQPFLSKLAIKVESITGDGDLFVSFTNANPSKDDHDYKSRRKNHIDQVTLSDEGNENWLNRPIFFSIYGVNKA